MCIETVIIGGTIYADVGTCNRCSKQRNGTTLAQTEGRRFSCPISAQILASWAEERAAEEAAARRAAEEAAARMAAEEAAAQRAAEEAAARRAAEEAAAAEQKSVPFMPN